jgi:exoribonuclease-2
MSVVMLVTVGKSRGEIKPGTVVTMPGMSRVRPRSRHDLHAIARRAMTELGLDPEYPPAVLAELHAIGGAAAGDASIGDLRDLRDRLWCSIDNDDSRDLDQLTVAEATPDGPLSVLVAVADVDVLVRRGSAIDGHARHNTTSVYTAGGIFAMLPERLSTDLTSLNEDADRLAVVIDISVDREGSAGDGRVFQALVRNRAKLAYNGVAAWLEGTLPAPANVAAIRGLDDQLRTQDRVARQLREVRHEQGALSLQTIEARPVFDDGELEDLRAEEKNRAKELIEDFMIAANGIVARFLTARGLPSFRRVLRSPERWERIVELAQGLGEGLPATPDARALEAFLTRRRAADPERFPDLSLAIVKLMGRGEYVVEGPGRTEGHFGLAVADYTHSTAPNRRFPDLITQRLLKAALAGRPSPYPEGELLDLARHCTEQEHNAEKVERRVRKSAAALLLLHRIGERFSGLVTGASAKGTWVRIPAPPIEGRVVRGFRGLDVGDRVTVELLEVDVDRGYIDFGTGGPEMAPHSSAKGATPPSQLPRPQLASRPGGAGARL